MNELAAAVCRLSQRVGCHMELSLHSSNESDPFLQRICHGDRTTDIEPCSSYRYESTVCCLWSFAAWMGVAYFSWMHHRNEEQKATLVTDFFLLNWQVELLNASFSARARFRSAKIQIGLIFQTYPDCPGKEAIKWGGITNMPVICPSLVWYYFAS